MPPRGLTCRVVASFLALGAAAPAQAPAATPLDAVRLPLDSLPVAARIDLPSSADWITFAFGSVSVVNYRPSRVSRIDTAANRVNSGALTRAA
jgi:hypothetical protein